MKPFHFSVSCSDDKTCKFWKSYPPNNQEGKLIKNEWKFTEN